MRTRMLWLLLVVGVTACDRLPKSPPLIIEADGNTEVACSGNVWVTNSEAGYEVEFTDNDGLGHTIYGIKKLSLSDVPKMVRAPMPETLPELYDFSNDDGHLPKYSTGQTIQPGSVVVWTAPSNAQARLVVDHGADGKESARHWVPVWVANTICERTPTN